MNTEYAGYPEPLDDGDDTISYDLYEFLTVKPLEREHDADEVNIEFQKLNIAMRICEDFCTKNQLNPNASDKTKNAFYLLKKTYKEVLAYYGSIDITSQYVQSMDAWLDLSISLAKLNHAFSKIGISFDYSDGTKLGYLNDEPPKNPQSRTI